MRNKVTYDEGKCVLFVEDTKMPLNPQQAWEITDGLNKLMRSDSIESSLRPIKSIRIREKTVNVVVSKNLDFWNRYEINRWEPETFEIFDRFISDDCVYCDVGSWIGPTVLYGGQVAKKTFAFEPDPLAYAELQLNMQANREASWISRISLHNVAIAPQRGKISLGSKTQGGDSMSSVLFSGHATTWEVESAPLAEFISSFDPKQRIFLKIDIEGGEYELVPSLRRLFQDRNIDLFLSLHPFFLSARLKETAKGNLPGKILRRIRFVQAHWRVIRALPFKHLYSTTGQPVNRLWRILSALLTGTFPFGLVATNREWQRIIRHEC